MEDRSCELVAWLDSDAFIVSSEPLEAHERAQSSLRSEKAPSQSS